MCYETIIARLSRRKPTEKEFLTTDEEGWSVAHFWAMHNKAPVDFPHWGLPDKNCWTVAHAAASVGMLPEGFNLWHLRDANGDTVAHAAVRSKKFPIHKFGDKIMNYANSKGVRVWDEIKKVDQSYIDKLKAIVKS